MPNSEEYERFYKRVNILKAREELKTELESDPNEYYLTSRQIVL